MSDLGLMRMALRLFSASIKWSRPGPIPLDPKIGKMPVPDESSIDESTPNTEERPPSETKIDADEIGGPSGREPTRYGDWERKGRISDF